MAARPPVKENFRLLLRKTVATVTFTKKDGSERIMKCSLLDEHIGDYDFKTEGNGRPENESVIAVWDVENDGWRSITLANIIKIEYDPATL